MVVSQGRQILQPQSCAPFDENYRERVRRSIEYLRQTSQVGTALGAALPRNITIPGDTRSHGGVKLRCPSLAARHREIPRSAIVAEGIGSSGRERGFHAGDDAGVGAAAKGLLPWPKCQKRGRLLLIIDVQSNRGAIEEVHVRTGDSTFFLARGFVARHSLDVQHVGAVAVQIEAKVREAGFKVDVDGCCWASPAATAADAAMVETGDDDMWVSTDPFFPTRSNRLAGSSEDDDRPRSHWQLRQRRPQVKRGQQRQGDPLPRAHADDDGRVNNASNNNKTGNNAGMGLRRNAYNSHAVEVDDEEPNCDAFFRTGAAGGGRCRQENRSLRRQRWLQRERGEAGRYQSEERDERTPFLGGIGPKNEPAGSAPCFSDGDRDVSASPTNDWRFYRAALNGWSYGIGTGNDGGRGGRDKNENSLVETAPRAGTIERDNEENAFHRARSSWSGAVGWGDVGGGGSGRNRSHDASAEYTLESGAFRHRQRIVSTTSSGKNIAATGSDFGAVEARPLAASALNAGEDASWRSGRHGQLEEEEEERKEEGGEEEATPRRRGTMGAGGWRQAGGWESAPEYGVTRHEMRDRRGAKWRSRGARGRRPVTREAVRQLHESERMHRLAFALTKKRERTRRQRDDLQEAREAVFCSGRLDLCSKTRELTDNLPKYAYGRRGQSDEAGPDGSRWVGGGNYRDAGDRLYSEWKAARRSSARRRKSEGTREGVLSECWTCPECSGENRAQDNFCQRVTGIAVAAQALRPDTWCRESTEKLGRAAAAALAAAGVAKVAGEGPGAGDGDKRVGGAGRVGSDGLRRCGRPRPEMFKPTTVARRGDGAVDRRRKGESLFDNLHRNPPTPSRRRAKRALDADTKASCTFTPAINTQSRRLADAQQTRRTIADAARNSGGGGGRDCGGSSDEGGDRSGRQAGDRRAAGGGGRSDGGGGGGGRSGGHGRGESGPSTGKRAVCKVMMRSAQLHAEHAEIGQRKEERRKELLSQSCPFKPDIGISATWPTLHTSTEDFVRRLHDEHREQELRLEAKRYMLYEAPNTAVDPATGHPLFSPMTNRTAPWSRYHRPSQAWDNREHQRNDGWQLRRRGRGGGGGQEREGHGECEGWRGERSHVRMWERGLEQEKRREASARSRDEARNARASKGHVNSRSEELVRGMRARSLMQVFRTLLASVEYARLPEGLDYDEAMESITSRISAIFDNDDDSWQDMTLEVAKADLSVLKPELLAIVTSALAGHTGETLSLLDFCELIDAYVETLVTTGGPMAHVFAPGSGRSAAGDRPAAVAAAARAAREEEAEAKELTFRPRIDKKSAAIARTMGRGGGTAIEHIFRREVSEKERRLRELHRQRDAIFRREFPFTPTWFSSEYRAKLQHGPAGRAGSMSVMKEEEEEAEGEMEEAEEEEREEVGKVGQQQQQQQQQQQLLLQEGSVVDPARVDRIAGVRSHGLAAT